MTRIALRSNNKSTKPENSREELNRILDKLSKVGYFKLNKKEKNFLKKFGDNIDNEKRSGEE